MAYLYRKKKSPFWYLVYFDQDGKEKHSTTKLRADDPTATAQARVLRAQAEVKEQQRRKSIAQDAPGAATATGATADNWSWVPQFLRDHCASPKSLERYEVCWKFIGFWLQLSRLHSPRQITYRIGLEYLDWRTSFKKKKTGKAASRNTAIYELFFLSLVMAEAVRRGYAETNPLANMKLRRDRPAKKPELSDAEIEVARRELKAEPEWMRTAFEIGLHTGCRLRETAIPLANADLTEDKITFAEPKGGARRAFSIPMPTALRPMFEKFKAEKREVSMEMPPRASMPWCRFFVRIGKPHLSFHCLRVTFINRLFRNGVPRDVAMRLVNHSSELVHKIYQRETVEDVMKWKDAAKFAAAA